MIYIFKKKLRFSSCLGATWEQSLGAMGPWVLLEHSLAKVIIIGYYYLFSMFVLIIATLFSGHYWNRFSVKNNVLRRQNGRLVKLLIIL